MGIGISWSSIGTAGRSWRSSTDLGGADEVWFNPERRPLRHPELQHSMPHSSRDWRHWSRATRDRRLERHSGWTNRLSIAEQNSDTTVTAGNPRTIHSVAADPNDNQIFLPIPAVGGTAPQFDPTLCDSFDERNSKSR